MIDASDFKSKLIIIIPSDTNAMLILKITTWGRFFEGSLLRSNLLSSL